MFLHPQIPDFQILSKPYINGNMIYSLFRKVLKIMILSQFVSFRKQTEHQDEEETQSFLDFA